VKTERAKLLSQIDDYLLPGSAGQRPVLVALVGSTGAGKSTLVNSIVGAPVSATGVRRPTRTVRCWPAIPTRSTGSPRTTSCPRCRGSGKRAGPAGPGRPARSRRERGHAEGIALLDTPDIDSVVQAHHEFAYQFLDASDLWLFMTSASRYADGPVWEILQHARDRKASLGVVMSGYPSSTGPSSSSTSRHARRERDRGRGPLRDTGDPLIDGMLPPTPTSDPRLARRYRRTGRSRVAVLTQTMSGVLDTFKTRSGHSRARRSAGRAPAELRDVAETAYQSASRGWRRPAERRPAAWRGDRAVGDGLADGTCGRAAASGRQTRRAGARGGPSRTAALNSSLRSAWSRSSSRWPIAPPSMCTTPGAVISRCRAARGRRRRAGRDVRAKQVFESVFGPGGQSGHGDRPPPTSRPRRDNGRRRGQTALSAGPHRTWRCGPPARSGVQDHLTRLVETGT